MVCVSTQQLLLNAEALSLASPRKDVLYHFIIVLWCAGCPGCRHPSPPHPAGLGCTQLPRARGRGAQRCPGAVQLKLILLRADIASLSELKRQ